MLHMKIEDIKCLVDLLCTLYPESEVDFFYPAMHGEKERQKLGHYSGYKAISDNRIVRIIVS